MPSAPSPARIRIAALARRFSCACTLLVAATPHLRASEQPLALDVDARDIAHGVQHAHVVIPATPGAMSVVYPKWIQGEHAPSGPLVQVTALRFTAGGRALAWTRDPLDGYRFRVTVPEGASAIEADFDYLSPPTQYADNYGASPNMTPHLALVLFEHVMLLPDGADARTLPVRARVRIPDGWKYDAAQRGEETQPGIVVLPEMSAAALVDSPLFAGEFARTIDLTKKAPATRISIFADAADDIAVRDDQIDGWRRVVAEAGALFGAHHYRSYAWLVALGDTLNNNGVEHHESTDIRMKAELFTNPAFMQRWASIFPHEYVHSWNGKYRRPEGLARADFQQPLADDLLWVYEGMTRYLGDFVLRGRAGFGSPEFMREYLAFIAATQDRLRPGRTWRPLADTAVGVPEYSAAPDEWTPQRRALDYYPEGALIWLEADTLIRTRSGGRRSLDDFCRAFFGGSDDAPTVRSYTRADVVAGLNAVQPYDWDAFLRARVEDVQPHAPLGGIVDGGWTLAYDDRENLYLDAFGKVGKAIDVSFSLGFWAKDDGYVSDVVHGAPAFIAGLAPASRVLAIGGRKWSARAAREVVIAAEHGDRPIELIVESGDVVRTLAVAWHGGLSYPHLVRTSGKADLLTKIITPKARGRD